MTLNISSVWKLVFNIMSWSYQLRHGAWIWIYRAVNCRKILHLLCKLSFHKCKYHNPGIKRKLIVMMICWPMFSFWNLVHEYFVSQDSIIMHMRQNILCTIYLALSFVLYLILLILVQYRIISMKMVRTGF